MDDRSTRDRGDEQHDRQDQQHSFASLLIGPGSWPPVTRTLLAPEHWSSHVDILLTASWPPRTPVALLAPPRDQRPPRAGRPGRPPRRVRRLRRLRAGARGLQARV